MFYVYDLIDPRDGSVFYVGKGKGPRAHQHERDARRWVAKGRIDPIINRGKVERIAEILGAGLSIEIRFVEWFEVEADAFRAERLRIAALSHLTNLGSGGEGSGRPAAEDRGAVRGREAPRLTVRLLRAERDIIKRAAEKSGEPEATILTRGGVAEAKRILGE